jgi:phosphatidylinositol dimannoside acyltransferase
VWLLRMLRIAAILTPIVPTLIGYLTCRIVGIIFFFLNVRARRNIIANLRHVDRHMPWIRRELTALRVCTTVVTNYYDLIRLRSVDRDAIFDLVDLEGIENIEKALERGKGAIILAAHVGNFSVMARLPAALGYRAAVVAEKVEPPQLFAYMARLRSAMGIEVIPPGSGSLRNVVRLLRNNGILLLAGDRDISNRGLAVDFFGQQTTLPTGPVLLAMRTGASLIPAQTLRTSDHRSWVRIHEEMDLRLTDNWDEDVRVNVQRVARELERMIVADPGQWAVLQRVWPPRTRFSRSEGLGTVDEIVPASEPAHAPPRESGSE